MISKNELLEIARFERLKPHQEEKKYIQVIVLNSIYSSIKDEFVFKGGTALFLLYGLNRFSEDLDFTGVKSIEINKIIEKIKIDLERLGIKCTISKIEEKRMSVTFRVNAEGPLFTKEIERCYVHIDISKRENVNNLDIKELKTIYPDIPSFSLCVMNGKEILAEKVRAILTRDYARDLFDLHFLLQKGVTIDFKLLDEKMNYYKEKFNKKEFVKKINEKRDVWEAELEPFVIGELPKFKDVKKFVLKFF